LNARDIPDIEPSVIAVYEGHYWQANPLGNRDTVELPNFSTGIYVKQNEEVTEGATAFIGNNYAQRRYREGCPSTRTPV